MKTKFYWVALLASATLIAQAKADGHHGGGGGGGGGGIGGFAPAPAPTFHSASPGRMGGQHLAAPGRHFSSIGMRSPNSFRQQRMLTSNSAARRFDTARTSINRSNRLQNQRTNTAREHLFGRRSADWHRDWDRRHDHWWHGHRCHFVNGFWYIYDFGYPYDYYVYNYDAGYDEDYYDQNGYTDLYGDSTVAAAQDRLARQGYYLGEVDGIFGPETSRAIARYQGTHGLRVTGTLTSDTLQALELRQG